MYTTVCTGFAAITCLTGCTGSSPCRLAAALKMLPQLVSQSSPPLLSSPTAEALPPLVRALASTVWRGTTLVRGYQLEVGEEVFK